MPGILKSIEQAQILDRVAVPGADAASKMIPQGPVKDTLTGKWLGHPLHPVLTDVAIGCWAAAGALDLIGKRHHKSAEVLTGLGIVAAVPTALSGIADWADTTGEERRVGMVHATGNTVALATFAGSYLARRRGKQNRAKVLSMFAHAVLGGAGFLGGHLTYRLGSGVDRTAFDQGPDQWTPVLADEDLPEGSPVLARAGQTEVLVYRNSGVVCAIANTCSHRGGPLNEGKVDPESRTVTCPWHASEFDLCTGTVVHGPASAPQPKFDARINGGKVELRRSAG